MKMSSHIIAIIALLTFVPSVTTLAEILETWESQAQTAPFTGAGDLAWEGDTGAFEITSSTWPYGTDVDFEGDRSLRSSNATADTPNTIVTRIDSQLAFHNDLTWSVYVSGNSADITSGRRVDFILLADTNTIGLIEDPATGAFNGYKLTLWDPYSDYTDGHEGHGAGFDDYLILWSSDAEDTFPRWRALDSILIGSANINEGWNLLVTRKNNGDWYIGYSNGASGNPVKNMTFMGNDPVSISNFTDTTTYAGMGWLSTSTDSNDFGFDNFHIPEPATFSLLLLAGALIASRRNVKVSGLGNV